MAGKNDEASSASRTNSRTRASGRKGACGTSPAATAVGKAGAYKRADGIKILKPGGIDGVKSVRRLRDA